MIMEVAFTAERWRDIVLQPEQSRDHTDALAVFLGPTWTYVDTYDHCIACGGLYQAAENIVVAWAYIGADSGPYLPALALKARRILRANAERWPLIRSGALSDFEAGKRLLALLGFLPLGVSVTHEGKSYDVFELARHQH